MTPTYVGIARNPEGQVVCVLVTANSAEAARTEMGNYLQKIAHKITSIETVAEVMDFRKPEAETFKLPLT